MASHAELHSAIAAAVASGRIGTPVFVRYLLHSSSAPNRIEHLRATVNAWMAHSLEPRIKICVDATEQISECLQSDRALALVSIAPNSEQREAADVTVLGTRGAIYFPAEFSPSFPALPSAEAAHLPFNSLESYGVLLVTGSQTHQEDYARAFAADLRCRIVAVTDEAEVGERRLRLNERLAFTLGVPYLSDPDTALKRTDVHIVSICAEPERRARIAVRCAEAGKHLYLDKPLAPRLEEARAIVAAVQKASVHSQMFSFVTTPWARRAKRLIESGEIGKIQAIHADTFFAKGHAGTVNQPAVRREEYPPERHQLPDAKRELDNIGVYPITLVRWLTGRDFASVHGRTGNFFFAEHERLNVEDFGLIAGTLDDGTLVTIAAGRIGWSSHPAGGVNRLILVGSRRTVTIDANRPRLEVYTAEPAWMPPSAHPDDPMAFWTSTQQESRLRPKRTWLPLAGAESDVRSFLDHLDAGSDSAVSAAEAARATEVLSAAYRSAATAEVVQLPLLPGHEMEK
jgi:predicted dehydrogenase